MDSAQASDLIPFLGDLGKSKKYEIKPPLQYQGMKYELNASYEDIGKTQCTWKYEFSFVNHINPLLEPKFLHQQRIMNVELLLLQLEDTAVHQLYLAEIFFHPLWFVKMLL